MLPRADSRRRPQGQRCVSQPRPSDVLGLCDRGGRRACCPEPTLTGGHTVREGRCVQLSFATPPGDASPTHAPATFCDFATAVRSGLATQGRLSPAVTRSEMRPPPTSQRRAATLCPRCETGWLPMAGSHRRSQGQRGALCPTFFRDPPRRCAPPPTSQRRSATLRPR